MKFLLRCPAEVAIAFYQATLKLQVNPYDSTLDIKPLAGFEKVWRLRIGKWRFLYEIMGNQLIIYFYDAGARGDIYK